VNGAQRQITPVPRISGVHTLPRELQLRDARRLRKTLPRQTLRTLACRITQRYGSAVRTLGVAGMCGFIAALGCFRTGLCSSATFVIAALVSLLALVVSLTVATLGDPYELARRRARFMR
jgi:hypothetical protein